MTVPFLISKLSHGKQIPMEKLKPLFNIANNVHQIRSKEVLCDCLHRAVEYTMKKAWLATIKKGFFAIKPVLMYELATNFSLPIQKKRQQTTYIDKDKA